MEPYTVINRFHLNQNRHNSTQSLNLQTPQEPLMHKTFQRMTLGVSLNCLVKTKRKHHSDQPHLDQPFHKSQSHWPPQFRPCITPREIQSDGSRPTLLSPFPNNTRDTFSITTLHHLPLCFLHNRHTFISTLHLRFRLRYFDLIHFSHTQRSISSIQRPRHSFFPLRSPFFLIFR